MVYAIEPEVLELKSEKAPAHVKRAFGIHQKQAKCLPVFQ